MAIVLNSFAFHHWDNPEYSGARITTVPKPEFIERVRQYVLAHGGFDAVSISGYAPFCRHIFLPNFTDARVDCVPITPDISRSLQSGYRARRDSELPVLMRWIEAKDIPGGVPVAAFLDLILYSRAQILLQDAAIPDPDLDKGDWDWGLISVKAQLVAHETPMLPITAMRNALGTAYGGSSELIDPTAYRKSVEFWENHVSVNQTAACG
jgi:hypothetical protein